MRAAATFFLLFCVGAPRSSWAQHAERFVRLVEFQVFADRCGPEVGRLLSNMYNETGHSHYFRLQPRSELFIRWDEDRRGWVDEAVKLGCFNLFTLGDDTCTAAGYLFTDEGLNPVFRDFYFITVAYAHHRGLMVGVESRALPCPVTREKIKKWARSFLNTVLGREKITNVIKLSIEWFDACQHDPEIAEESGAFSDRVHEVNPEILVYVDSMTHAWS